jgi:hypothetical protein
MMRRDYIIRMIEEFARALAGVRALKNGAKWPEAAGSLDAEFQRLVGDGPDRVAKMSETELLGRIVQGEATQAVRDKTLIVTTLLREAGDIATAQDRIEDGRACYLKGLNLLLETLARGDVFECPEFVPKVEEFLAALQGAPLPLETLGRLMEHYERAGDFGKAEDMLFAMLAAEPGNRAIVEFGISFYERLAGHSDSVLTGGNLSRPELAAGLAELRQAAQGFKTLLA